MVEINIAQAVNDISYKMIHDSQGSPDNYYQTEMHAQYSGQKR